MSEERVQPALAHLLYDKGADDRAPVVLFDVGCSGGVEADWFHFGKALHAVGFDPLVTEVDRLNSDPAREANVKYVAAFVGCSEFDTLYPKALRDDPIANKSNASFERTGADAHAAVERIDYIKENFNRGSDVVLARTTIQLDDYIAQNAIERVDLLKVDTDGHDIEVLLGARKLLSRCLAVKVEAQFHGAVHSYANTFSNIDQLLRGLGFSLVDMEPFHYTRSALPGEFCYDLAAQTVGGSIQWAEAIYARDLADPDYERKHPFVVAREDVFKLAVFLDIFGLQDSAAELLLARRNLIDRPTDPTVDQLLDAITPSTLGPDLTYASYIAKFRDDPSALFPSRLRPAADNVAAENVAAESAATPAPPPRTDDELATALASADEARRQLAAMRQSTSWRVTAPLRALLDLVRPRR